MKLLFIAIGFGLVSILIWFGWSVWNTTGQEFGLRADTYFWPLLSFVFVGLNLMLARRSQVTFWQSLTVNKGVLFFGGLFLLLASHTLLENLNYFFTKRTITENCPIGQVIYYEKPVSPSEDDPHIYPYYELHLTIDQRAEQLDVLPNAMDSIHQNHLQTLRLTYREGLLGRKFLLTKL